MSERLDKWASKIDGDVRKKLYDEQKDSMVAKEKAATDELVDTEIKTKAIIQGEPITLIPYYIIFAKELCKKRKLYTGQTLINEAEILQRKWYTRGLNALFLIEIKKAFIGGYESAMSFHLDYSLLDGPHLLS